MVWSWGIKIKVSGVIRIVSRDGIWEPAARVVVSIEHVADAVSGLRSSQACPEDLRSQEIGPGQHDRFA